MQVAVVTRKRVKKTRGSGERKRRKEKKFEKCVRHCEWACLGLKLAKGVG
jgi:hypothetical protein